MSHSLPNVHGTHERLAALRPQLERRAARVTVARRGFGFRIAVGLPRWTPAFPLARRAVLARNHLLFAALAMTARGMSVQCRGVPDLEIFHARS